ncbi:hypothetical protein FC83_GL002717 [Agrilactobacillus composti DSM 18527 = JCM 14202]|uniref:Surface layer protein A domain-containing protein n=1 Tax=Agrilactobacillus composti DSM 18527 = JCM 14202 TaxID=1423734 RepID=X0PUJ3_9LACO|nr:hypothetical protein [Agrilactobacillus composti]KRM36462.1 hypothetical protein FC83_GL002717 [Agrilactobacillus composti DSM 18527 = JCM 14202]GAF41782.1 hypothetical protein JCM14202_3741 [Agrilactobacillus composti DSM 18527 = JCM 14202]
MSKRIRTARRRLIVPLFLLGVVMFLATSSGITKADKLTIKDIDTTFTSKNQPISIYSDPETTQNTGRTLNIDVNTWRTFQAAYNGNYATAFNLGGSQWVKASDSRPNELNVNPNGSFREFYSNGEATTIYSDPYLTQAIGKLDPSISHWEIIRVSNPTQADGTYSFDLGNNQWVGTTENARAINQTLFFQTGTKLFNSAGQATQTIDNPQHFTYQIFDVKTINDGIYVNLGNDSQWALFDSGTPY